MDCIILCGGFGTRLQKTVPHLPKALAPINGLPFMNLLFNQLKSFKRVRNVILATGYRAEEVQSYCKGIAHPLLLDFSHENTPLGTGGAVKKALQKTSSEHVLVLNGDCYSNYSLEKFYQQHVATHARISLLCPYVKDTSRFGKIEIDSKTLEITSFIEKGNQSVEGWINGGTYLIEKTLFLDGNYPAAFSIEKDVFPKFLRNGMYAYLYEGVFIDIGTHSSFIQAQKLLEPLTI